MRVYFEDGKLGKPVSVGVYVVDAANGPTWCMKTLKDIQKYNPNATVYTNYLGALSFDFSWDRDENESCAFIRNRDGHWRNVQNLTSRELRFAHNIPKMYMAGAFVQRLTTFIRFNNI